MISKFLAWIPVALFAVLAAQSARADLAFDPPEKPKQKATVPLVISFDEDAKVNRLVIPKKLLAQTEAGGQAAQPDSSIPTIIAGLALSLALASLVLVRGRSRAVQAAAVAAVLIVGVFAAVQMVSANGGPPLRLIVDEPPKPTKSEVVIEIVEEGDAVQFIRPAPYIVPTQPRGNTGSAPPAGDGAAAPDDNPGEAVVPSQPPR